MFGSQCDEWAVLPAMLIQASGGTWSTFMTSRSDPWLREEHGVGTISFHRFSTSFGNPRQGMIVTLPFCISRSPP
jgi:hypothetical protein